MDTLRVVDDMHVVGDVIEFMFNRGPSVFLLERHDTTPPCLETLVDRTVPTDEQRAAITNYSRLAVRDVVLVEHTCNACRSSIRENKFAVASTPYSPVNVDVSFSLLELRCPNCNSVFCSVLVPSGTPFEKLPEIMRAATAHDSTKIPKYILQK